jgi:hypothetical protein
MPRSPSYAVRGSGRTVVRRPDLVQTIVGGGCEGRQAIGHTLPTELILHPHMKGRREGLGVVQAAGHDIERGWLIRLAVCERRATLSAEAADDAGRGPELDRLATGEAKPCGGHPKERQGRGRGSFPAAPAMADAALQRSADRHEPDRPTETAAVGFALIHNCKTPCGPQNASKYSRCSHSETCDWKRPISYRFIDTKWLTNSSPSASRNIVDADNASIASPRLFGISGFCTCA